MPADVDLDRTQLDVTYGLVTDEMLAGMISEDLSAQGYLDNLNDERITTRGLGKQFDFRIRLMNDVLPPKAELDVLIAHGVHESRTFYVNPGLYDTKKLGRVLAAVYSGIIEGDFSELPDVSSQVLDFFTIEPVLALHQGLKEITAEQRRAGNN